MEQASSKDLSKRSLVIDGSLHETAKKCVARKSEAPKKKKKLSDSTDR